MSDNTLTRRTLILSGAAVPVASSVRTRIGRNQRVPTRARIATVAQNGRLHRTARDNRAYILSLLQKALVEKPDLVCLPEDFPNAGCGTVPAMDAEPLDGPTVALFAQKAKQHQCYIVVPLHTRQERGLYNSAVILGRDGRIVGVYNKRCPVTTSPDYTVLEDGIRPGETLPVFDLDFGRIAIQICFDIGFPENWRKMAEQGARLVLWPSAYDGGFPLRVYAFLHHYWVVSSTRTGASRIIDPCAEVLAETSEEAPIAVRDINLDYIVAHWDFNFGIPDRVNERYGAKVSVRTWDPGSAHMMVEPVDPAVTSADIQEALGLETCREYHNRHRAAYRRALAGKPLQPQRARHGNRPQYGK